MKRILDPRKMQEFEFYLTSVMNTRYGLSDKT